MMDRDVVRQWLSIAGRKQPLPQAEINALVRVIRDTNSTEMQRQRALTRVVLHNLKSVVDLTLKYVSRRTKLKLTDDRILDYLQAGVMGLVQAAQRFDPDRGYKFTTYSYNWIRGFLGRHHYATYSMVHIPANVLGALLNNKPHKYVAEAKRFQMVDSLDRLVVTDGEAVPLLAIVADEPPHP